MIFLASVTLTLCILDYISKKIWQRGYDQSSEDHKNITAGDGFVNHYRVEGKSAFKTIKVENGWNILIIDKNLVKIVE